MPGVLLSNGGTGEIRQDGFKTAPAVYTNRDLSWMAFGRRDDPC